MKRRLFPILLLLLFAHIESARAQAVVSRFYTDPPVVYENEPFDIVIGGLFPAQEPPKPHISGSGAVRIIELPPFVGGPIVNVPWGERLRIDGLLPGTYTFRARALGEIQQSIQVVVHPKPFTLSPRFGVFSDEVVLEDFPNHICTGTPCAPVEVLFGSTPARNIRFEQRDGGMPAIVAEVPEGSGVVDVHLTMPSGRYTLPAAFRFSEKGLEGDYERVLFPINFAAPGAHGADWRTKIQIRNDAPVRVPTEPLFYVGLLFPDLPALMTIEPGGRGPFYTGNRDGGAFLHVARGLEKSLTYSSHIFDRSRGENDRGAEVPVVRADDTASEIRILDVPLTALFRSHLRVYSFDDVPEQQVVDMIVHLPDGTEMTGAVVLPAAPVCVNPPCLPLAPSFHGVDLSAIDRLKDAGKVDITLRAPTRDRRIWGFVSVASNETQRVTIYTPQHETPAGVVR